MFKISNQKLIVFIALGLAAIIVILIGVSVILRPKKTPVAAEYITVTVDNSVGTTFTLDKTDFSIIKAETVSKVDSFLVDSIDYRVSFTQAMNTFVRALLDAKKINGEQNEVLLFAVESQDQEDFESLANLFRDALKENNCNSRIYTLYFKVKEDAISTYAQNNISSYAKAYLCKKIEKETELTADELISVSITEIVERVNKAAKGDLVDKIESETNEEQKKEEIKEENKPVPPQSSSSEAGSSSSEPTSSGENTSGGVSSEDASSKNSFGVESGDDEHLWTETV